MKLKLLPTLIFILLSSFAIAQPANDDCLGAIDIGSLPLPGACIAGLQDGAPVVLTNQSTVGATISYSSGNQSCGGNTLITKDIWYKFKTTGTRLNLSVIDFPGVLFTLYYGGRCDSLGAGFCTTTSSITLQNILIGKTVYLRISGADGTIVDPSFSISLDNDYDCDNCYRNGEIIATPPPVNGTYSPGQVVQFVVRVYEFSRQNSNWLHGIQINYGSGWSGISGAMPTPANCSSQGNWIWKDSLFNPNTGLNFGQGYYFDQDYDGDPTNNWGDGYNPATTCPSQSNPTYVGFYLTASSQVQGNLDLSVSFGTTGDGESGGWANPGCSNDNPFTFLAASACNLTGVSGSATSSCLGGTLGSVTNSVTGSPGPLNYRWFGSGGLILDSSNAASVITKTGLPVGTYTCVVTDTNFCSYSQILTVAVDSGAAPQALYMHGLNSTCSQNNGIITIDSLQGGTAPYLYSFDNGIPNSNVLIDSVFAGIHQVKVIDQLGCYLNESIQINNADQIQFAYSTALSALCAQSNGSISIDSISGGPAPYQYSINGSAYVSSPVFNGLLFGNYSVAIKDSNQCLIDTVITVQNASGPNAITNLTQSATCGNNNGKIIIAGVSGGAGPYQYAIDGVSFLSDTVFSNLDDSSYIVTVKDNNLCLYQSPAISISNISGPSSFSSSNQSVTCAANNGVINVNSVVNGSAPFLYALNNNVPQTSSVFDSLAMGVYFVSITDTNMCSFSDSVSVGMIGYPTADSIKIKNTSCSISNGQMQIISVTNGVAPYTYSVDNSPYHGFIIYGGLGVGTHSLMIKDANNCLLADTFSLVNIAGPDSIIFHVDTALNQTNSGAIYIDSIVGGTAPYYSQFNYHPYGSSDHFMHLFPGVYNVTIYDSSHCAISTNVTVPNLLVQANVIRGVVYNDINNNCIQDNNEPGIPNAEVYSVPDYQYGITDSSGAYVIYSLALNGSLNWYTQYPYHHQTCPTSPAGIAFNFSQFGSNSNANNFGVHIDTAYKDLQTGFVLMGINRPGFNKSYIVNAVNYGLSSENAVITLNYDSLLIFQSADQAGVHDAALHKITWLKTLDPINNPGASVTMLRANFTVSTLALTTQHIKSCSNIEPLAGDASPYDNHMCTYEGITASYDPNIKQVSPVGEGPEGNITAADSLLTYTIHFQNTGTDTAFYIYVLDTLSSNLDPLTLKSGAASHPYTIELLGSGVLKFAFNNILLVDSTTNEPDSHGWVTYSIKQRGTNSIGDEIKNTAAIYFDYNDPVMTNTTLNTIASPVYIHSFTMSEIEVFPNPASDHISIRSADPKDKNASVEIYNALGQQVLKAKLNNGLISVKELANGLYSLKISNGNTFKTKTVLVQH